MLQPDTFFSQNLSVLNQVALNSDEVQKRTQTRINILRLLSDSIDPQPQPMTFVIPHCKKASIRSELERVLVQIFLADLILVYWVPRNEGLRA